MLLKLTHTTDLMYSDLISESVMELRMAPRQEQDQHRLSFNLAIGPATQVTSYFDWLANTVHTFTIGAFHRQIRIVATSVVETDRQRKPVERFSDQWPFPLGDDYTLYDYVHFSGPIIDSPRLRDLVEILHPTPGASLGELALRILHLIAEKFEYKKGITNAASPITDVLDTGKGVCQDFTHLMIGMARALGIPARYVSGLVHSGNEQLRGDTQTHAWCELLFPSAGWVGFDPTNNCIVGTNFVKVGVGRDYRDVPPNKGRWQATGTVKEKIDVSVQSEELPSMPPELAAERMQSLGIPSYPGGSAYHREMAEHQIEMQQQQQQSFPTVE
jgi:transglutaminase-like putative cysteine protease